MGSIPVHFAWECDLYQSAAVTFASPLPPQPQSSLSAAAQDSTFGARQKAVFRPVRGHRLPVPACRLIKVPVRRPRHSENYTVSPHAAEVQTTFFAPGIWVTSQVKVPTTTVGLKRGRDGTCTLSDAAKVLEIEVDIAS